MNKEISAMQLLASVTRKMKLNKLQQCIVWNSEWSIKEPAPEILVNSLKSTNICSFWSASVPSEISTELSVAQRADTTKAHECLGAF